MSRELRRRRRSIESARATGQGEVAAVIRESWRRCQPVIEPERKAAPVDADADEVRVRWEHSPIRRSGVGVEEQLGGAASAAGMIAAITDSDGRILWTSGERRMRGVAEGVGFVPGGRWDEESAGTNALGLALLSGLPASVFAAEHWCESVSDWVCWSSPVTDTEGRRVGVLDLSGPWDTASPVAQLAVTALARLVEEHLPPSPPSERPGGELELRLLGRPEVFFGGRRLSLTPRQTEILAALAIEGPARLDELRALVYGDRSVSPATVKAELSHLRQVLGGGIGSRPYQLTVPVRVDALDVRRMLSSGDVAGAADIYGGQLLPDSEAPFAVDQRHLIDATLRRSLLKAGTPGALLKFADVHRYDTEVLERVVDLAEADDPLGLDAEARLEVVGDELWGPTRTDARSGRDGHPVSGVGDAPPRWAGIPATRGAQPPRR